MPIASYSSKHDISYTQHNNKLIPWKLNTSYIYQNNVNNPINRNINEYFENINNSLVIESSQNNIILLTQQNRNVIVENNMVINSNLDVSNYLNTSLLIKANNIYVNRYLYLNSSVRANIIGDLRVNGSITITESSSNNLTVSTSEFTNLALIVNPTLSGGSMCEFFDVSINTSQISLSNLYTVSIKNSYIYNTPIGYDKYNNIAHSRGLFSDVLLYSLVFDSSLNIQQPSQIKFVNNNNSIIIRGFNNYSKLYIDKPLIIGQASLLSNNTNNVNKDTSNISIFDGDISCHTLYYKELYPDVRLNNYFDVSIALVSVSGSCIPKIYTSNIGSIDYSFTNIYSTYFNGYLNGATALANDLQRNLDMSFNNLDITGVFNFRGDNLEDSLTGRFLSISGSDISYANVNQKISDLSANNGLNISILNNYIDSCFNNPLFTRIRDVSAKIIEVSSNIVPLKTYFDSSFNNPMFTRIRDVSAKIIEVSSNILSLKTYFDSSFNNPLYRRIRDVSAKIIEVSSNIVPLKTYFDSSFNNPLYNRINDVSANLNTLRTSINTSFSNIYTITETQSYFTLNYVSQANSVTQTINITNNYNTTEMNNLFNPISNFNTRILLADSKYYHYNILNTFPATVPIGHAYDINIINIASNKNGNIIVAGYPASPKFIIWELNSNATAYVNRLERNGSNSGALSFVNGVDNAKVGICVAISYSGLVVAVASYKRIRVYYRRSTTIGWVELDTPPPSLEGFEGTSFEPYVSYSMARQPDFGTTEAFDFAHNINNIAVDEIGATTTIILGVGWNRDRVNIYIYSGGTQTYIYNTATITRSGGSWTTQVIYASTINQPTDRDFGSNITFAEPNLYYGHNMCFSVGRTILTYFFSNSSFGQDAPPFTLSIGDDTNVVISSLKVLVGTVRFGQAESTVIAVGVAKHNFVGVYTRQGGRNMSWVLCYSLYGTTYGYSSPISRFGACVHICSRFGGGHLLAISVPNKIINTTKTVIRGLVEIFYISTFDSNILPERFTTMIPSNYNYGSLGSDYNKYFGAGGITITETKLVAAPQMVYTITYTYLHKPDSLNAIIYETNENFTRNSTVQFFNPVRFDFNSYGYYTSYFPTNSVTQNIAKFQKTGQTSIIFKGNGDISYRSTRASFSDVRLKENIINCSPKLLDLLKIRVVDFKFKGTDNSTHIGVIAQELETLFPDLVSDIYPSQQDIKLGKTEIYKAVKYSSFDVILIKALQEQLAIINNLTLQLDEIESKCKLLKTIELETVILNQDLDFLKKENDVFKQNINEILNLMNK